jgi:alkylation response protein AidB-like acyl-CoA dehydrogenase
MDFQLNDEQRLFRQTLRDFVDREIVPVARDWERSGRYPTEIVEGMRKLGLFGLLVPEEYGGLAADTVSFALTFEEISRGWMGIAGILAARAPRHAGAARPLPAGAGDRGAAYRHRAHRARRRHRPAGHQHHGPPRRLG